MVAMKGQSGVPLAVGRFAGWEPLGFEAGDNNWYRFVANGPTERMDPSGLLEDPVKPRAEASPQARQLEAVMDKVLGELKTIAKSTTDEIERGGYILHVREKDEYPIQECKNKQSGPTNFEHGGTPFRVDGFKTKYVRKPLSDGFVHTDGDFPDADIDWARPVKFTFHTHPPKGEPFPSPRDCATARKHEMPDVMIMYMPRPVRGRMQDTYFVWISDVDGKSYEYGRFEEPLLQK